MKHSGEHDSNESGPAENSRGSKRLWIVVTVVAALLGALLVVVTNDERGPESASSGDAPVVSVNGLVVTLSRVGGGSADAALGRAETLIVEVVADAAVDEVQLWDGADQLGQRVLDGPSTSRRELIAWQPSETGEVELMARAVDVRGRSAQSNVLRVSVDDVRLPMVWAEVEAADGDSVADIADTYGSTPEELAGANPDLDPDMALAPGTPVVVPITDPLGFGDLAASSDVQGLDFWSDVTVDPKLALDPPGASILGHTTPQISASVDECEVTVEIVGIGDRFVISELSPSGATYLDIAEIDADSRGRTLWTAELGPGHRSLVVGAEHDGGLTLSDPVEVAVSESCGGEWSGDVRLVGGLLTVVGNDAPAEAGYAYLSTDGANWQRVPADDGVAVPFNGIGFDVHEYLPTLGGNQLDVDAWGWSGGALVHLGTGRFDAAPGVGLASVIGSPASAALDLIDPEATAPDNLVRELDLDGPGSVELRWTAPGGGVTHGLWQVTTLPPDNDRWLDPVGLVAQGQVEATETGFEIDFENLANVPNTLTLGRSLPTYEQLAPSAVFIPALQGLALAPELVPLPQPFEYWIRVVPMSGDQPVGILTNTVEVDTAPDPEPPGDPNAQPYLISVELQPPTAPDLRYSACYLLEEWDLDRVDQAAFAVAQSYRYTGDGAFKSMQEGGGHAFNYWIYQSLLDKYGADVPICAGCYGSIGLGGADCGSGSSNFLEDFVGAVVDLAGALWNDVIVAGFNAVKDVVVDTLITITGCEAIASQIGGDDGEDACRVLAEAAVDSVLMAYGIPPNLPTTGDLIAAAKGDLQTLIVELAESYGVPCDALADASTASGEDVSCESVAGELLDELETQLSESYRAAAPAATGMSFPPGARVIPYPAGQVGPARFDITLTPNPEAREIETDVCNLFINLRSTWETSPATGSTGYTFVDVPGITGTPVGAGQIDYVAVAAQRFQTWPFVAQFPQVTVDPDAEVRITYYLYQVGSLTPVPVIYGIDLGVFGHFVQVDASLPKHVFVLREGAQHEGIIIASCAGSAVTMVDTGAPGPGQ